MNLRLLDTGFLTAAENMALDGIILEEVEAGRSPATLRFLRFSPAAALVGYNQDVANEVREDYCRQEGIEINRRHTGGGAILFDPSVLGFELFWPADGPSLGWGFETIVARLGSMGAQAVSALGAPAAFRPRNDIEIDGRKVSGTGLAFLSRAFMFQGTLLVENCLERMIRALRVPVEKLKRREIQSLLKRVTFLADELGRAPADGEIKAAFVQAFAEGLGANPEPGPLTEFEQSRLEGERSFYSSDAWVRRREVKGDVSGLLRAQSGRLRVAIWADLKQKRIKQALISGDFFTRPNRLVMDLEGAIKGASLKPEALSQAVNDFLGQAEAEFVGVSRAELARTLVEAAEKGALPWPGFDAEELNRVHPIGLGLNLEGWSRPEWLLLPYCAKDLACPLRHEDGCEACGECPIGEMYDFAERHGLNPVSITSFEHLMEVLGELATLDNATYVGSCCEAFLAKHQHEMEATGVKGLIVSLNSLTCYDLGKETDAYVGRFERQSEMDAVLLSKVVAFLVAARAGGEDGLSHGLAPAA